MVESKLRATYSICSKFAKWARLLCKSIEFDCITTHNRLLQLSQSLPLYCANAISNNSENYKQQNLRNALSCAFELSQQLQQLSSNKPIDDICMSDSINSIDSIITRLTEELISISCTIVPSPVKKQYAELPK